MRVAPERFLEIFDSLDYHVAIYDRDWRYTYVNAEAARVLGRSADELLGRSLWELFPEAIGNQYHRELHDAAATGRAIHGDHYHAPFDRWFENHIYPLPDGVLVLSRDVTDERAAAHAAHEREHMLRLAQQAGGVATFVWDFVNQQAQCSAEFFRIFGLPEQEGAMPAGEWAAFLHPEDRDRMAAHVARALRGEEPAAADYRIVRRDGSLRWLSYAGQLLPTAHGDRMIGTVIDVTARMEAEAALRHSRDVLSLAMRGGAMGAWSRDLATNAVWWSPELEEIVGLPPGAFSGTEDAFFDLVHADDREAVRRAVGAAVVDRTDYIVDFRFRHASGEWRWMEGRGRAAYAADGRPISIYGIGIDVTARKRDEAALQAAKDAAEAANRLKDQFLANLSHELRTPLNAILGYARLLQTGVIAPEKWRQAVAVIERNAVAQNQLVEDLLDMSRITTGTVHLDPAPVPVASMIRQAADAVGPPAEAKGIVVALELDPFAGMVNADATRLQQVFWNLLNNAVKFTPAGGRIEVRLARTGHDVEAAITDSGIGIPEAFLPHVFEPFRQADARFGRRFGGLGLGLAICRQLVELHGGSIAATSDGEGRGATFVVRLPACDTAGDAAPAAGGSAAAHDAAAPAAVNRLAGVTVLLVEDDADTLALFTTTLEAEGARVRTAATPAEALAMVERWRPDLLVSDLGLPGMDGYELLHAIRARTGPRAIAAVAVSAYARPDDRARAEAAGFQAHIAKPVDPGELVRALAATIAAA
jgi:PAS domain S-box-containing protein